MVGKRRQGLASGLALIVFACLGCGSDRGRESGGAGQTSGAGKISTGTLTDPCTLLSQAEVEAFLALPATTPTSGSSTEAGGKACSWDAPRDSPPKLTLSIDLHPTDQYLPSVPLPGYDSIAVGSRGFLRVAENSLQVDCAAGGRRVLITHGTAGQDARARQTAFVLLAQTIASRLSR